MTTNSTRKPLRFSEKDIHHAMLRLGLSGPEGRERAIQILREWDRGIGDVDDVIDEYEDAPAY